VRQGLVDSAPDCCTAILGSIPPPGIPIPRKTSAESPAQIADDLRSAGRTTPAKNLVKYCTVKLEKNKLKGARKAQIIKKIHYRVPGRHKLEKK
jgi:hypothetical protein